MNDLEKLILTTAVSTTVGTTFGVIASSVSRELIQKASQSRTLRRAIQYLTGNYNTLITILNIAGIVGIGLLIYDLTRQGAP